jgi:hypothetical protein
MMFGYMTLATALILSLSAAVYSILGLTAIFAAAFWPIVILGGSLEIGKIVTVLWLHKYWQQAEIQYKLYLSSAVIVLMILTSMGVFGFLSKAHLDQAIPSGDVQAQVQIFDDKIRTQKDNIEAARKALSQMDAAVDQTMSRSSSEQGADKAANLRRSQGRERTALQNDISKAQKEITGLQEQRAPVASAARKVDAEVGPIKYIAALIYGDSPEANVLERAVRWVIILIVVVFDPLALTLLLAATKAFEWEHNIDLFNRKKKEEEESKYPPDDGPLTDKQMEQIAELASKDLPIGKVIAKEELFPVVKQEEITLNENTSTDPSSPGWMFTAPTSAKWAFQSAPEEIKLDNIPVLENEETRTSQVIDEADHGDEDDIDPAEKQARRAWKAANPNNTLNHQRALHKVGHIAELPWHHPDYYPELQLQADNMPTGPVGEVKGFGLQFPTLATKGDMFLRVDRLPSALYKYNGANWIEVDKDLSDNYAYDDAYIDHLIAKIDSGEYDPELLSEAERNHIEQRLKKV